ncbi:hypothetical protein IWQ61_006702 [Dispira simplex]|nr:hypothetical protein IWQ61_006702 [Dispira simplex]
MLALLAQARELVYSDVQDPSVQIPKGPTEVDCNKLGPHGECLDQIDKQPGQKPTVNTGSFESIPTIPHNEALNVGGAVEEYGQPAGNTISTGYGKNSKGTVDKEPPVLTQDADKSSTKVIHVNLKVAESSDYQCGIIQTEFGMRFVYSAWRHYCSFWQYSKEIGSGNKPLENFLQFSPDFQFSGNITLTRYKELGNEKIKDLKYERYYMKHNPNREEPYSRGCVEATEFGQEAYLCLDGKFLYFSQFRHGAYNHEFANLAVHATRPNDDDCDVKKENLPTFDGQQRNQQHHTGTPVSTDGQSVTTSAPIGRQYVATYASTRGQQQATVPGQNPTQPGSLYQETDAVITPSEESKHPCDPSKANHREKQQKQQYQGSVPDRNPTQSGSLYQEIHAPPTFTKTSRDEGKLANYKQLFQGEQWTVPGVAQHQHQPQPQSPQIAAVGTKIQQSLPHHVAIHCHHATDCHDTTNHKTSFNGTYHHRHPAKPITTFIPQKFDSIGTTHTGENPKDVPVSGFVTKAKKLGYKVSVTEVGGVTRVHTCTWWGMHACVTYDGGEDAMLTSSDIEKLIEGARGRVRKVHKYFTGQDTPRGTSKATIKAKVISQIRQEFNKKREDPLTLEEVKIGCGGCYKKFTAQQKEYHDMHEQNLLALALEIAKDFCAELEASVVENARTGVTTQNHHTIPSTPVAAVH